MYAEKGDILQFVIQRGLSKGEIRYSFAHCPYDIALHDDSICIDLRDKKCATFIERNFHRFNVIKSNNNNLKKQKYIEMYSTAPESTLRNYEPDEEENEDET